MWPRSVKKYTEVTIKHSHWAASLNIASHDVIHSPSTNRSWILSQLNYAKWQSKKPCSPAKRKAQIHPLLTASAANIEPMTWTKAGSQRTTEPLHRKLAMFPFVLSFKLHCIRVYSIIERLQHVTVSTNSSSTLKCQRTAPPSALSFVLHYINSISDIIASH